MGVITVRRANPGDLGRILEIQRAAFMEEARAVNDYTISPLVQSLEGVREDLERALILAAEDEDGSILGSIRGEERDGTTFVFKFTVDPGAQGRGVGGALLNALEEALPMPRFQLHTRKQNYKAIGLYLKNGYVQYKEERLDNGIEFVYLEKIVKPATT
jgi:ribosomal protein S18 acetylase RimI-like enzyme